MLGEIVCVCALVEAVARQGSEAVPCPRPPPPPPAEPTAVEPRKHLRMRLADARARSAAKEHRRAGGRLGSSRIERRRGDQHARCASLSRHARCFYAPAPNAYDASRASISTDATAYLRLNNVRSMLLLVVVAGRR